MHGLDPQGDLDATLWPVTIRWARPADAAELTRLRGVMYDALGVDPTATDWQEPTRVAFAERLARERDTFAAVVAADESRPGRLLACAVGWIEIHLPSPGNPAGRRGHVANVATDPAARRRGLGAAVVGELMGFFAERGVPRIDLEATPMGEGIYRRLGFRERHGTALSWRIR